MRKIKPLFIALSLGLLLILLAVAYSHVKHQELLVARHHLLCEVLKPGMSEDEVLEILHKTGEFTMNKGEWKGGIAELGINFIDPKSRDLYGGFELRFSYNKYVQAYISSFDYFEDICNFYPLIKPPTETPRPRP
jgi:hypothetical protein